MKIMLTLSEGNDDNVTWENFSKIGPTDDTQIKIRLWMKVNLHKNVLFLDNVHDDDAQFSALAHLIDIIQTLRLQTLSLALSLSLTLCRINKLKKLILKREWEIEGDLSIVRRSLALAYRQEFELNW